MAAVDDSPDEHRKEVAKVMASLRQTPTLYDTESQEANKKPPKKANEAQSKKRRASTVVTTGKKIIPILPGRKRRRGKKHGKQEIGGI